MLPTLARDARCLLEIGKVPDFFDFDLNCRGECEGIGDLALFAQRGDFLRISTLRLEQTIQRCLRRIVTPREVRTFAHLALQLDRRLKQIHHQSPFADIQVIHRDLRARRIIAIIADEFADVRPILLLNMRIVIFFVGTRTREFQVMLFAVAHQVRIQKFTAVVRVNGFERKGQRRCHLVERRDHAALPFAHYRTRLGPTGENIG